MQKQKKINLISSKLILDDFFKVEEARLQFEQTNGEMSPEVRRLNFERNDSVAAIIWHTGRQKIILGRQFRYPASKKGYAWLIEAIAGSLKTGEDPETAMKREILEEAGYQVAQLKRLSVFFVSPGGTSERIFLYLATVEEQQRVSQGGGLEEEAEDIELLELGPEECRQGMETGEIQDAKTIIGLQIVLPRISGAP